MGRQGLSLQGDRCLRRLRLADCWGRKFKARLDGTRNRHVYYHCTRQVDYNCREPYLKEPELIRQLQDIIDQHGIDLAAAEPGFVTAVTKFSEMRQTLEPRVKSTPQHSVRYYARYVLQNGSDFDKTRLVRNIGLKLTLHDRKLVKLP